MMVVVPDDLSLVNQYAGSRSSGDLGLWSSYPADCSLVGQCAGRQGGGCWMRLRGRRSP